ncbi:subclass B3 metallo-beta-lactamase [Sphingomonas sp. LT1P40]|uniref:subclass B3 metallo-beta-lactamase n=1 Tax=Alteristakelama amylovorans TaxID=3096166 RepID=UPI002FC90FBA
MFVEAAAAFLMLLGAPDSGQRALAAACAEKDGWSDPAPPARIHGQTWYVGTCGITVLLIATPSGHVLIDGATEKAAPYVLANIRKLGFDPRDVKLILSTHEHDDHVAGLAALKAATGARVLARAAARRALESGRVDADDPQAAIASRFPGVKVDRIVADGEVVRLGKHGFTAIATPGHTSGGTSWSWRSCEKRECLRIVFADSLNAVSADDYRFSANPKRAAMFRGSFVKVAALDCGLLLTGHPGGSDMFERFAGKQKVADRGACEAYAAGAAKRLDARLAKETGR